MDNLDLFTDVIADICTEAEGKTGKVISITGDRYNVQYGNELHQVTNLKQYDFFGLLNENIEPKRGMIGKLETRGNRMVMVCESHFVAVEIDQMMNDIEELRDRKKSLSEESVNESTSSVKEPGYYVVRLVGLEVLEGPFKSKQEAISAADFYDGAKAIYFDGQLWGEPHINESVDDDKKEYDRMLKRYQKLKEIDPNSRTSSEQSEYETLDNKLEDLADKIRGAEGSGGLNEVQEDSVSNFSAEAPSGDELSYFESANDVDVWGLFQGNKQLDYGPFKSEKEADEYMENIPYDDYEKITKEGEVRAKQINEESDDTWKAKYKNAGPGEIRAALLDIKKTLGIWRDRPSNDPYVKKLYSEWDYLINLNREKGYSATLNRESNLHENLKDDYEQRLQNMDDGEFFKACVEAIKTTKDTQGQNIWMDNLCQAEAISRGEGILYSRALAQVWN